MHDPSKPSPPISRDKSLARLDRWAANVRQLARLGLLRPVPGSAVKVDPDREVRLRVPPIGAPLTKLDCGERAPYRAFRLIRPNPAPPAPPGFDE
jgi:hypothetical protein